MDDIALSQEQTITLNYISTHCAYHKRSPKWYEEQLALKGQIGLSDYLRSELPTKQKIQLRQNNIETLANDLVAYVAQCKEPFRVLTDTDVVEPDCTNELSYFIWAKGLGFDVDMAAWCPSKARTLAPVHLGCLAAQTNTLISENKIPWTTWLAQLVTDWYKGLHSHETAITTLYTEPSLRVHMLFNKNHEPDVIANSDKIQYPSPGSRNRECDNPIVDRQGNASMKEEDGVHEGKLALLACLYKRMYPRASLTELICTSKEKSIPDLFTFFCEAISKKIAQPTTGLAILQLCANNGRSLQTTDHVPAYRSSVPVLLACLRRKFPGHFDSIDVQRITRQQFAIIVGYFVGRTEVIPSPEASIWDLLGLAKAIVVGNYQCRVSMLLEESFGNPDAG